jgi:uncharacterized protein YndB with AHSA1/START domain
MAGTTNPTIAEREILVSRVIDGPRRLVFQAFTDARHLARWFGPNGFTVTTKAFAFRPGGEWLFTMHGPDGTDYPNWVQWQEIVPPERLVYRQGQKPGDSDAFQSTVTLVEEGDKTRITLRSLLNTKAQRDEVVQKYNALEGAKEALGRLAAYAPSIAAGGE